MGAKDLAVINYLASLRGDHATVPELLARLSVLEYGRLKLGRSAVCAFLPSLVRQIRDKWPQPYPAIAWSALRFVHFSFLFSTFLLVVAYLAIEMPVPSMNDSMMWATLIGLLLRLAQLSLHLIYRVRSNFRIKSNFPKKSNFNLVLRVVFRIAYVSMSFFLLVIFSIHAATDNVQLTNTLNLISGPLLLVYTIMFIGYDVKSVAPRGVLTLLQLMKNLSSQV